MTSLNIEKQIKQCTKKIRRTQDIYIKESYLLLVELNQLLKLQKDNEKK